MCFFPLFVHQQPFINLKYPIAPLQVPYCAPVSLGIGWCVYRVSYSWTLPHGIIVLCFIVGPVTCTCNLAELLSVESYLG